MVSPAEIGGRAPSLWRYHELLPVGSPAAVVSFGEGMTPLLPLPRLGRELGVPRLLMKDEGPLPTASFKARGAAVGVSRAAELGAAGVAMPTNGNAGAAWAAFCARAGLPFLVAMPASAPEITRSECVIAGAETLLVDGLISDAGRMLAPSSRSEGWLDVSTLKEPYRLEGKKTIGLEIFEQLGWRVPDVILCPVGGGVGLIGIYKALAGMPSWAGSARWPRLVAVQAEGCAPVVSAFQQAEETHRPWPDASTVAFGITVPAPLGGFLVLRAIRETEGCAVAVSDKELLTAQAQAARAEGAVDLPGRGGLPRRGCPATRVGLAGRVRRGRRAQHRRGPEVPGDRPGGSAGAAAGCAAARGRELVRAPGAPQGQQFSRRAAARRGTAVLLESGMS